MHSYQNANLIFLTTGDKKSAENVELVGKKVMTEGLVLNLPMRAIIGSIIHGGMMVRFS